MGFLVNFFPKIIQMRLFFYSPEGTKGAFILFPPVKRNSGEMVLILTAPSFATTTRS